MEERESQRCAWEERKALVTKHTHSLCELQRCFPMPDWRWKHRLFQLCCAEETRLDFGGELNPSGWDLSWPLAACPRMWNPLSCWKKSNNVALSLYNVILSMKNLCSYFCEMHSK